MLSASLNKTFPSFLPLGKQTAPARNHVLCYAENDQEYVAALIRDMSVNNCDWSPTPNTCDEERETEPTEGNLNAYRIARAKARRDVRLSKKISWRNYISKLNSQASVKYVWNRIPFWSLTKYTSQYIYIQSKLL